MGSGFEYEGEFEFVGGVGKDAAVGIDKRKVNHHNIRTVGEPSFGSRRHLRRDFRRRTDSLNPVAGDFFPIGIAGNGLLSENLHSFLYEYSSLR